ncbi:methyl-accepting chemotaxis protein [Kibdelosporangium banguiense]|uniref:Methyl-accepting chemotaxis protein n=1 Tax=Kibdelosporangium banguiense TaxID=1365924 RepID=A0ABS4TI60_9PSEU|nr:cache domain-containing protein [Kibdelosporangium banguiense]MBP2323516.1 methyl-accepting chemotaxis protein [Kibdelosporangium banguiense]
MTTTWIGRRQTRLEKQLAEARFPGGVGVPSSVGLALSLLLAVFCACYLQQPATPAVPAAVVEPQERFTASMARTLAASVAKEVTNLRVAVTSPAAGLARDPDDLLVQLGEVYPRWRGMALVEGAGERMIAARGEPVPLDELDRTSLRVASIRPVARAGHGVLLVATIPLGSDHNGRLLVASLDLSSSEFPLDERLGQSVLLVTATGAVVDSYGPVPATGDRVLPPLIRAAAAEATAGRSGSKVGATQRDGSTQDAAVVPVVAYAPLAVAEMSGTLGLSLVSVSHASIDHDESQWHPLVPAAALVVVAILGFALVRAVLVGPVRRLRADAIAVASGVLDRTIRISKVVEVRRIAAVIENCRVRLRGEFARPNRRSALGFAARHAVILGTAALLAWSALVAMTVGVSVPAVPAAAVAQRGVEVAWIADSVRRSLDEGMSDLKALSRFSARNEEPALRTSMAQLAGREDRYRSVYLVDLTGRIIVHFGRPPLRAAERLPVDEEGLHQYNTSGRLPVIFAHRSLPDGQRAVVAEFDVEHISGLLRQSAGRARIVDTGLRTIADTEGYLAFQELSDDSLRRSAGEARTRMSGASVMQSPTGPSIVASVAIGGSRSAAMLGWVVVTEQLVAELNLPGNELRRRALVVALLGMVIALLHCGWHELMFVRPLRRTAAAGERLVNGDIKSVIYPVRQDHIGTITSCLEICRQALTDGAHRLGDVRRPRGRPAGIPARPGRSAANPPKHALIRRES